MALTQPIDHGGFRILEGYRGETTTSGTDAEGKPWNTIYVQTTPISGTSGGALHVYSVPPTGSVTGSSGYVIYGSGSDGLPHPIGATQNSDGTWSIQTDTELILSGNVVISNVRVYSTDGTSASLVYGRAKADGTVYSTPDYSRATHSIDLVDTDVGLTSSDYNLYEYKYFCLQFSNMLNCTASISGTLDSVAADPTYWIPITVDISGYHAITGSCIICQDTPVKWEKIRVNFSKSITSSNSIDLWVSLYN
jgi:hypothetical protein